MADDIIKNVNPNIKAVDLGDGTFGVATVMETAQDRGIATGGSNVTCVDTTKAWIVNGFIGDTLEVTVAGVEYHSLITANTADTITMNAIGAVVVEGDPYKVKSAAGAEATIADGADATQGAIADAIVAAGAAGTISAKLRRVTQGLADLLTGLATVILAAGTAIIGRVLPLVTVETPFTGAGNVVVGTHNIAPGAAFKLTEIELHLSAAPTTGVQNLVITLDDGVAAAYDVVILTIDLVANAITDLVITPNKTCKATDVITAAWTNTDGRTFGLKFKHQLL